MNNYVYISRQIYQFYSFNQFLPDKHFLTVLFLLTASILFSLNFYQAGKSSDTALEYGYSNNQSNPKSTNHYLAADSKVDANKMNEKIIRLDNEPSLRNSSLFSFWNDPIIHAIIASNV